MFIYTRNSILRYFSVKKLVYSKDIYLNSLEFKLGHAYKFTCNNQTMFLPNYNILH